MSDTGPIEHIENPAPPTPIRPGVELVEPNAAVVAKAEIRDDLAILGLGWGDMSDGPNCRATCATCGTLVSMSPLSELVGNMRQPIDEFNPSDLAGGWETSADADQVIECVTNGHTVTIERL